MNTDRYLFIIFAKFFTFLTYVMMVVLVFGFTIDLANSPAPEWLAVFSANSTNAVIYFAVLSLCIVNIIFIPLAVAIANHEALQGQRRDASASRAEELPLQFISNRKGGVSD